MPSLPQSTQWLIVAASGILALQGVAVLAMVLRNLGAEWHIRRHRGRSRMLREIYDALLSEDSPAMRRTLARRDLTEDAQQLEAWLDLVTKQGRDPAQIPANDYEHAGLVEKYVGRLREQREWTRRAAAAELLGWTNSSEAVPALLECAQDVHGETNAVRAVALRALGRIRHPDAIAPLVATLDSGETWFPPVVASILVRMGQSAVAPLSSKLKDTRTSIVVRRWAAQILGEIRNPRALPALHRALSDVDAELRAKSATALGNIGEKRSVDLLLDRMLVDPIPIVRTCVAKALGQLSTDRTVEFLVEALADSEWWVRLRAVEALAQLGHGARELLSSALHDRDAHVAHEAARALEGLGVVTEVLDDLRADGYRSHVGEFLIDVGKAGNIEPFLDELESNEGELIHAIVRILARVGDRRAGPALAELLDRDLNPTLRARVVDALRRVGDGDHVERVVPLMQSDDEWIRKMAIDYLGEFASADVMPLALPLVTDENPWTRESALRLLERLQPPLPLPDELIQRLDDPVSFVRNQAVRTLCVCRAFAALQESTVMQDLHVSELREALLEGLAETADSAALPLIASIERNIEESELDRLRTVLLAVYEYEPHEAIQAAVEDRLLRQSESGSDRWAAAVLLSLLPASSHASTLDDLAADRNPRVRAAAANSMRRDPDAGSRERERLHELLNDNTPLVVRGAISALAFRPATASDEAVTACLRHADLRTRVDAALALGHYEGTQSEKALRTASLSRDCEVQLAAQVSLVLRNDPDSLLSWLKAIEEPENLRVLEDWRRSRHPIFADILERAADVDQPLPVRLLACTSAFEAEQLLVEHLDASPHTEVRRAAIAGLTALSTDRPSGRIFSVFRKDPSPEVRATALRHLVQRNVFGRQLHFLELGLRDPVEAIQVNAVHLTVVLDPAQAIPLLVDHLETRRPRFLDAMSDMLAGYISDDPESVMDIFMGHDNSPERMMGLIEVLRKVSAPLTTELLEILFRHQWAKVRAHALHALVPRLGSDALPAILRAVSDPSPMVRERAIRCISSPNNDELRSERTAVASVLARAAQDPTPTVRARAALAMAYVKMDGAQTMLRQLKRDPNERVVRAAERALKHLTPTRRPKAVKR